MESVMLNMASADFCLASSKDKAKDTAKKNSPHESGVFLRKSDWDFRAISKQIQFLGTGLDFGFQVIESLAQSIVTVVEIFLRPAKLAIGKIGFSHGPSFLRYL